MLFSVGLWACHSKTWSLGVDEWSGCHPPTNVYSTCVCMALFHAHFLPNARKVPFSWTLVFHGLLLELPLSFLIQLAWASTKYDTSAEWQQLKKKHSNWTLLFYGYPHPCPKCSSVLWVRWAPSCSCLVLGTSIPLHCQPCCNNEAYSSIDNTCLGISTGSSEHTFSTVSRNGCNRLKGLQIIEGVNFGVRPGLWKLGIICYWIIGSASLGLYILTYTVKIIMLSFLDFIKVDITNFHDILPAVSGISKSYYCFGFFNSGQNILWILVNILLI